MGAALSAPFAVAAIVLCAAGVAKLRSPGGAVAALVVLGLPGRRWMIRTLAAVELALGALCLLAPSPAAAGALAAVYCAFAGVSLALARRRAACGCFGAGEEPASEAQAVLSAAFAAVACAGALTGVHGAGWLLDSAAPQAVVVSAGVLASAYAVVLLYTRLPESWSAWSGR